MKGSELKRLLRSRGCYLVEEGARHEKWHSPISGRIFLVPRHDSQEVATGTLGRILRNAGLRG